MFRARSKSPTATRTSRKEQEKQVLRARIPMENITPGALRDAIPPPPGYSGDSGWARQPPIELGLEMAPPMEKLQLLEQEIKKGQAQNRLTAADLIEMRTQCLALTHLACAGDNFQFARAYCNLAICYMQNETLDAALRHALKAEALIQGELRRVEAAGYHPTVLYTLGHIYMRTAKYRLAAEYLERALSANQSVQGKEHPSCCPIYRGWAHMAVLRNQDYGLARDLLYKELDIREVAYGTENPEVAKVYEELASMCIDEASMRQDQIDSGMKVSPTLPSPEELQNQAIQLLSQARDTFELCLSEGQDASETARVSLRLAVVCSEKGDFAQAEQGYLAAVGHHENTYGMSDKRTVALWNDIARMRVKQHKFPQAEVDLQHIITMQTVLYGRTSSEVIETLRMLAQVLVLQDKWEAAQEVLMKAHTLCLQNSKFGKDHKKTRKITEMLDSLVGGLAQRKVQAQQRAKESTPMT